VDECKPLAAGLAKCGEVPWSVDAFFIGGGDGGGR
jgi:hypothetical protein